MRTKAVFLSFLLLFAAVIPAVASEIIVDGDDIDLDVQKEILEAWGNVVITAPDLQINAEYAKLNMKKDELRAEESSRLQMEDWEIFSEELELDLDGEYVWAREKVRVISPDWTLEGEELDYYAGKSAELQGPGELTWDDLFVEGDHFFLELDTEKLEVTGNTYLQHTDLEARADKIVFQPDEYILLIGNVSGSYGDMRVEGERVRYILPEEEGRIKVEKGRLFMPATEE